MFIIQIHSVYLKDDAFLMSTGSKCPRCLATARNWAWKITPRSLQRYGLDTFEEGSYGRIKPRTTTFHTGLPTNIAKGKHICWVCLANYNYTRPPKIEHFFARQNVLHPNSYLLDQEVLYLGVKYSRGCNTECDPNSNCSMNKCLAMTYKTKLC